MANHPAFLRWWWGASSRICSFMIYWFPAHHQHHKTSNVSDIGDHLQRMVHHSLLRTNPKTVSKYVTDWQMGISNVKWSHSALVLMLKIILPQTWVSALNTLILWVEMKRSTSVIGWDSPSGACFRHTIAIELTWSDFCIEQCYTTQKSNSKDPH